MPNEVHPVAAEVRPAERQVRQDRYKWRLAAIHKLRVEVKMLASHARLLREEAKRADFAYHNELTNIRRGRLRVDARMANVALAFVRGRSYASVEGEERIAKGKEVIDVAWLRDDISYFTGDAHAPSDCEVEDWVEVNETKELEDVAHSGDWDHDSDGQEAVCGGGNHQEGGGPEADQAEGGAVGTA